MSQLTINIHNVHLHATVQASAPAEAVLSSVDATSVGDAYTLVLADGTHLPADCGRTDHVAVIDHATGLMWAVESLGSPDDADDGLPQAECAARCAALDLLGHNDWRLPTRSELAGLIDDTRHEPAIDTALFPRVKPRWHWTSTPAAWSSASAWLVSLYYGSVSYNLRYDHGFGLACRRAGQ